MSDSKFALITGASSGIGLELAKIAAADGYDLLIAADMPEITGAADELRALGAEVEALQLDLTQLDAIEDLLDSAEGRPIDILCANAGQGLGGPFLEQEPDDWCAVIDTNVTGTLYLLQNVLRDMRLRGEGRVLVTGSIAGFIPGPFNAVYNGTKAFIDNFTEALRRELKDEEGITLTTLMPGPTDTDFFERADLENTELGSSEKADPAKVARDGWDAMMAGKGHLVSGWMNKLQVAASGVLPQSTLAEQHAKQAQPNDQ